MKRREMVFTKMMKNDVEDDVREPAVQAEDLSLNETGQRQVVEQVREVGPDRRRAVFAEALVVEPVDLCDLPALVVAAQDEDPVRVPNLKPPNLDTHKAPNLDTTKADR